MRALHLAIGLLFGLHMPLAAQEAVAPSAAATETVPATVQPSPAAPAAPDIIVLQSLDPASGVVVGQRVMVRVDVLFRGQMPRPPRVSLPDLAGAQVLRFETQATTMREAIDGTDYVGQRFEFALYARRGGTFAVPPASVTLLDRQGETIGTAAGQSLPLEVRVPSGVDTSGPVVATRRLTLTEQWAPEPAGTFKAGDAIVRTLTRTAEDVPGLAMRDLAMPAPEGARAYVDPPDISDHSNRGIVTGQRQDRVTYVFERGGQFDLPAVEQPWWDLGSAALRVESAQGAIVTVSAPAGAVTEGVGRFRLIIWMLAGTILIVIAAGGAVALVRRNTASAAHAERQAFAALRQACSVADAGAIYRAFAHWRRFLGSRRDSAAALAPLDATLFAGRPSTWDAQRSDAFLESAARLRRSPPSFTSSSLPLPPLNP